jgi:hypothetical protein
MYIIRLCMRPHVLTNMSPFNQSSTRLDAFGKLQPGVLQFSQFNITVNATNEFTNEELNYGLIQIRLDYEPHLASNQLTLSMVYFAFAVLLIVSFLSLIYLSYRQQEMRISSKA